MESSFTASSVASHEAMIRYACEGLVDGIERGTSADCSVSSRIRYLYESSPYSSACQKRPCRHCAGSEGLARSGDRAPDGVPLDEQLTMAHNILEMHRMISRLIEERYVRPQNDLLTIIAKGRDEFSLNEREMLSLVPGLFLAGTRPWRTNSPTCSGDSCRAERWRSLVEDRASTQYFDEALRCDPSVYGMWRIATRDTVLLGQSVPAGQKLFLVYLAANRDERH